MKNTKETKIKIGPKAYLNEAFERIPSNAIIDKGRCGIGGTTLELNDDRNSLIVVPNVSIIKNKMKEYPHVYGVFGQRFINEIEHDLKNLLTQSKFKIMSTPDSFYKVMEASKNIGYDIYSDCFLLFDECHSAITEGLYREKITSPFKYFFDFREKSLISATPYPFTDPRFESLDKVTIEFTQPLGLHVEVIVTDFTIALLKHYLKQEVDKHGPNIHLFFNSVEFLPAILEDIPHDKVSVFCADNAKNRNNLGDFNHLLSDINGAEHQYRKINIYTTKYYEGWDLLDDNAVVIFATDVNATHTCQSIPIKAVQAIGRARHTPKAIYHITNTRNYYPVFQETQTDFTKKHMDFADNYIRAYNFLNRNHPFTDIGIKNEILHNFGQFVSPYADISNTTGVAEINYCKVDSLVNDDVAKAQFNNVDSVMEAWGRTKFSVSHTALDLNLTYDFYKIRSKGRVSKQEIFQNVIGRLDAVQKMQGQHTQSSSDAVSFFFEPQDMAEIRESYPEYVKYYEVLGLERISDLGFNVKKVKEEYCKVTKSRFLASIDVAKLLSSHISPYNFYPSEYLKALLRGIYESLDLPVEINAKATDITNYYDCREERRSKDGKTIRGFYIKSPKFRV